MTYIKKIILENFQSHNYTEITFSKKMNVIVGHSDSGKTAILRAIKWCLFNEPGGLEFIRQGESQVKVELVLQNDTSITRLRTKSKNQYILKTDTEEVIYEGFGSRVPSEIVEASGIRKISLDDKNTISINYSSQLEGPFLLTESSSTKASAIGRLVGVNIIDDTMRTALRDKKQTTQEKNILNKNKIELEDKIKSFDYLDNLITKRDLLQNKIKVIAKKNSLLNALSSLKEKKATINNLIENNERILNSFPNIDRVELILNKIKLVQKDNSHYNELNFKYKAINEEKRKQENISSSTNFISDLQNFLIRAKSISLTLNTIVPLSNTESHLQKELSFLNKTLRDYNRIELISTKQITESLDLFKLLSNHSSKYLELNKRIDLGEKYLLSFKNIDEITELTKKIKVLGEKYSNLNLLKNESFILNKSISDLSRDQKKYDQDYLNLKKQYLIRLQDLEKCPLCHQSINDQALHNINQSLEEE